ncbi:MAG: formylmethanofuran dehydrogenase subunit E family protein [Petrotogales bacterium]
MNGRLKQLERFHGHLGPYVVLGYKMGEIAIQMLGPDPFTKNVVVWAGTTPPISCIIDGIQMSSGCTLGKGNILVKPDGIPKACFSNGDGKHVEIELKNSVKHEIDKMVTEENMASYSKQLFQKPNQKLFEILVNYG